MTLTLIWALVKWKVVDLAAVGGIVDHPGVATIAGLFVFAGIPIAALRWRKLLSVISVELPFFIACKIVLFAVLAGMVLPGTISGESVRIGYVALVMRGQRSAVLASIVVDRIAGIFGLATVGALLVLPVLNRILLVPELTLLAIGLWLLLLGLVFGFALTWSVGGILSRWLTKNSAYWLSDRFLRVRDALRAYRGAKRVLIIAWAQAVLIHVLSIYAVIIVTFTVVGPVLSPWETAFATPASLLVNLVPLTPGGIGVGEAAFSAISVWLADGTLAAFGTALLLYRIIALVAMLVAAFSIYIADCYTQSRFLRFGLRLQPDQEEVRSADGEHRN